MRSRVDVAGQQCLTTADRTGTVRGVAGHYGRGRRRDLCNGRKGAGVSGCGASDDCSVGWGLMVRGL